MTKLYQAHGLVQRCWSPCRDSPYSQQPLTQVTGHPDLREVMCLPSLAHQPRPEQEEKPVSQSHVLKGTHRNGTENGELGLSPLGNGGPNTENRERASAPEKLTGEPGGGERWM